MADTNGHATVDSPYKPPSESERLSKYVDDLIRNATPISRGWLSNMPNPHRDLYRECGYPSDPLSSGPGAVTVDLYRALYDREPIATRVVELLPMETWQVQPLVYEDEDAEEITPFEEAWDQLGTQLRPEWSWYQDEAGSPIWEYLKRVDILSGIGSFGVLLLGVADGKNFQEPISGVMSMVTNSRGQRVPLPDSPIHPDEEAVLNALLEGDGQREVANPFNPDEPFTVNVKRLNDAEREALAEWKQERVRWDEAVRNAARNVDPDIQGGRQPDGWQNTPEMGLGTRSAPRRQGFKADTKTPSVGPARTADGRVVAGGDGPFGTDKQYDDVGYGLGMPPPQGSGGLGGGGGATPWSKGSDNVNLPPNQGDYTPPQSWSSGGNASGDQYGHAAGGDGGEQDQLASAMGPQGGAGAGLGYSLSGTDQQYFGVIMGPSEQPAQGTQQAKPRPKLVFLRAFDESLVQIVRYEWNIRNPRFGLPVMYRITLNDPRQAHSGIGLPLATIFVHWSRVIHVADNLRSSEVFGVPRMRPVLNPILDIQKVRGASAEGYWQSCFAMLAFETHPQLGPDVVVDKEKLDDAVDTVMNKLRRHLYGQGGAWKMLAPSVVDPTPFIDCQKKAIANEIGCPMRVFDGSERGELASSTDDQNWDQRKRERQLNYLTPRVVVPFADRLIQIGVLPEPGQQSKTAAKEKVENLRKTFGRRWFVNNVRKVQGGWVVRNSFTRRTMVRNQIFSEIVVLNAAPKKVGVAAIKAEVEKYTPEQMDGLGVWVNGDLGIAVIDRMDWYGKARDGTDPATAIGKVAEKQWGEERVIYQNEGKVPKGEGWITLNKTPNDPSQRTPPNDRKPGNLGTGGDTWRKVDDSGKEPTDNPSTLQGATKQGQASFSFIPEGGYSIEWPASDATSAADKAGLALQYTQALAAFAQGGCEQLMSFKDYLVRVWKWEEEHAEAVIDTTKEAHENDDTLSVPPNVAGQPKAAAEGTQAAADAKTQADQAKAMLDAKAKQPMTGGGKGMPPVGQKAPPNKQDAKIAATAKSQAGATDET